MDFGKIVLAALLIAAHAGWLEPARSQEAEEESAPQAFNEAREAEAPSAPETGFASFYHTLFHGRRTASGETFNRHALTAAHRSLPFGTLVRVTNLRNERSVIVRVNDRGPHNRNRVIDVSPRAARELGFLAHGVTWVMVEVIGAEWKKEHFRPR